MKKDWQFILAFLMAITLIACKPEPTKTIEIPKTTTDPYIAGIDISAQVLINKTNTQFYDSLGRPINV